ncbi:MAG: hypothetical protein P4L40_13165 [Terracidiphilus sp.]|nr:hypothetical protein [Terracidiphilus sp.]
MCVCVMCDVCVQVAGMKYRIMVGPRARAWPLLRFLTRHPRCPPHHLPILPARASE